MSKVRLSWVRPTAGYFISDPLDFAHAAQIAGELKSKFPEVHETLTIHTVEPEAVE